MKTCFLFKKYILPAIIIYQTLGRLFFLKGKLMNRLISYFHCSVFIYTNSPTNNQGKQFVHHKTVMEEVIHIGYRYRTESARHISSNDFSCPQHHCFHNIQNKVMNNIFVKDEALTCLKKSYLTI